MGFGIKIVQNDEMIQRLKDDIEFLKTLPLYIALDNDIVISHASCTSVWHLRDKSDGVETFESHILWSRQSPKGNSPIFNIYGHTPFKEARVGSRYINIDTGACYFGKLSAYCIESKEVIEYNR